MGNDSIVKVFATFSDLAIRAKIDQSYSREMGNALKRLILLSGKKKREVMKDLSVHQATFDRWLNGKNIPHQSNVDELRRYFLHHNSHSTKIGIFTEILNFDPVFITLLELLLSDLKSEQPLITPEKISTLVSILENGDGKFDRQIMSRFLGLQQ